MASPKFNIVSPELELSDPNPDIHELFVNFNVTFFSNLLGCVELKWSPRMTLCAGLCRYVGRNGQCSIHLSKPLLTLRSRKDLIETLLHEMIHAYLFVVDRNKERESHGPKFTAMMHSINKQAGTNITVYHSFHDEVKHFKVHWWQCDGPCRSQPPYFGMVKRSMNRAPGPNDIWYADHKRKCNGKFNKVKEPPPKAAGEKVPRKRKADKMLNGSLKKISDIFPKAHKVPKKKNKICDVPTQDTKIEEHTDNKEVDTENSLAAKFDSPKKQVNFYGIIPFSGKGNSVGGNTSVDQRRPGRDHPLLSKWEQTRTKCDTNLPTSSKRSTNYDEPKAGSSKDRNGKLEALRKEKAEKCPVPVKKEKGEKDPVPVKKEKGEKDPVPIKKEKGSVPVKKEKAEKDPVPVKKESDRVVCFSSSDEDEVITLSSEDEKEIESLCPACGIEYKEFLQTLEEHLQSCEMLADF